MSVKARMHARIDLEEGLWVCRAKVAALDPLGKNPTVELGPWSMFREDVAAKHPALFEKWKDLMKEIMQYETARINKQTPAETKVYDDKTHRKDQN